MCRLQSQGQAVLVVWLGVFGGMDICEEAARMVVAHGCHMLLML